MHARAHILRLSLPIVMAGLISPVRSDISYPAVGFLQQINSPRANGMGGCVVSMVSEESAYYNPASLGLLHLDKAVSFVIPHSTKWYPEMTDDIRFKSWSASAGVSRRLLGKSAPGEENIALGIAYSYTALSYGTFVRLSEYGEVIDQYESYDAATCLAVGLGFQRKVRIGIGYAIKFIDSRLAGTFPGIEGDAGKADGTAHQIGLIAELPIHDLTLTDHSPAENTRLKITPTLAYVLDNMGKDLAYIDAAHSDKLPKLSRVGLSLLVAVASANKEFGSIRGSVESEKLLVDDVPSKMKAGLEIGILGAFFARRGLMELDGSTERLSAYGLGFRLRGLLNEILQDDSGSDDHGFGPYLSRHVDLSVDYAKYGNDNSGFSKTWFYAISLSL